MTVATLHMTFSHIDQFINDYRNEKNTRKLLPYREETVSHLRELIKSQEEYVGSLREHKLLKALYEQELERIKYVLTDYLKIRLMKLQKDFYVDSEYLSEYERVFYQKLVEKFKEYDVFVEQKEEYNDYECVGFIALVDIGNIVIDGNRVDVLAGDFFVAQLADVKHLLLDRKIMLV